MTELTNGIPSVSWTSVETILVGMATSEDKRLMVQHLVEGTRKQAPFLTPEGILSDLFYLAAALLDSSFLPSVSDLSISNASSSSSASPPSRC